MANDNFDVAIVGGGMVGSALACALGDSGLKIALIEPNIPTPFDANSSCDLRVSAISYASENILESLGVWQSIKARRACAYRRMLVWSDDSQSKTHFNSARLNLPHLGHIVENVIIQLVLHEKLAEYDNIELICPAHCDQLDLQSSKLELDNGRTISARLIVAADGGQSKIRETAKIPVAQRTYSQHAFVATVETELPQQDITWQRYVRGGPQAFLPLPGHRGSLVWYNTPEKVRYYNDLPEEQLIDEICRAFPQRLGKIHRVTSKGSFPLIRRHAKTYIQPGLVLLGDAAHTIHPQIGQGVNMGLLDMAALATVLKEASVLGEDFSQARILGRFERWRRFDNTLTIGSTDALYTLFKSRSELARMTRNVGLTIADKINPINRLCTAFAVGKMPHLPPMALQSAKRQ